jgi:hypothetical protein
VPPHLDRDGWSNAARTVTSRETHGRWPWVAATAAAPVTAAVLAARGSLADETRWAAWLPLPALLWHQTEEWVMPGGFLPWFNRTVLGSDADEFPITRRLGLAINVGLGWGGCLAAGVTWPRVRWPTAAVLAMHGANTVVHVRAATSQRRYNPGLATATGLFAPLASLGFAAVTREPGTRLRDVLLGAGLGVAASAGAFRALGRRAGRDA